MKKNNSTDDSGSFFSGLTIGLFAGAVGYYLFASEKGSKLVKKVSSEWEKAQKEFPAKVEESAPATTIKTGVLSFIHELISSLEDANESQITRNNSNDDDSLTNSASKRVRKKSTKSQFKNTN